MGCGVVDRRGEVWIVLEGVAVGKSVRMSGLVDRRLVEFRVRKCESDHEEHAAARRLFDVWQQDPYAGASKLLHSLP